MATTVQLNTDTEWSDEPYAAYYGKDESYGGDDDEGFLDDLGGVIKSGVSAVGNILTNPIGAAAGAVSSVGKILGVSTSPASTAGIQKGGVGGSITTAGGKKIPVQVPDAAHKQDIQVLQQAIQKINSEIKQVADTTTSNGVALAKLTKEVKHIDDKHNSATKKQNELIAKLGTGVDRLGKDLKSFKSQEQMNMMLTLLSQPQLESITFASKADPTTGKPVPITQDGTALDVKSSTSTDNTTLLLLMTMMGGSDSSSGGGGGMFGDMANNPLMMILMLKAFSGGSGSLF
jgi:hypothetical protein